MVDGLGGPFRKYMVPEGDTCRIYNAPRPEVVPGFLTVGQAKRNVVTGAFGRSFDWSERSSKHIAFDLRGPKDVQLAPAAERPMTQDPGAAGRSCLASIASSLSACCCWSRPWPGRFTVHQAMMMDEMEAAMWRDMNMSMNGMEPSWTADRRPAAVCDVVGHDGGDDGAGCKPDGLRVSRPSIAGDASGARRMCPTAVFLLGYLIVWAGFLGRSHGAAMGAAERPACSPP